jgi:hypothetical protein
MRKGNMVLRNITNFVSRVLQPSETKVTGPIQTPKSNNPFAGSFIGSQNTNHAMYGQNKPVMGGFFAGYYNGKPNIVGTRLFVEA